MKIKIFLGATIISLMTLVGCESWLDVNTDPNSLSDLSSPEVVIPAAQISIANMVMGWDMGFAGGFWSQYWTQNYTASQFKYLDEYQETSFGNAYSGLYSGALNDLKAITRSSEPNSGDYLIAEVLSIYTWQVVTDVWGDMPYFEALQGDEGVIAPVTNTGQEIYADLLKRVDALLEIDYEDAVINSKYDFVFGGDVHAWIQFANSLKLKLMIRLSETPGYDNAAVLAFVESGDFLDQNALIHGGSWEDSHGDERSATWEDKDGKRHPMVEYQAGGANYLSTNVIASRTFLDYLRVNADPRIDELFKAPSGGHKGAFQGDFASKEDSDGNGTPDDKEEYSTVEFAATSDIPFITEWEVEFYIAEVYARASDNANAKAHYDNAVQASLDYWDVDGSVTGSGEYAEWQNGTVEEGIKQIAMQKWVSYCKLQHVEAFLERNRTKYPSVNEIDIEADRSYAHLNFPVGDFTISVTGRGKLNGNIPASPIYPNTLINRNPNSPAQKLDVGEKVWWNVKAGK